MPRFIAEMLVFALLQIALLTAFLQMFCDMRRDDPISAATGIKHRRAAEAPSPRIILVGGSNLLFGIDSELIEHQTRYHPVNLGLLGGLRLDYQLNEAAGVARPGDLVVLAFEYVTLNAAPDAANMQAVMGVLAARPANARYLTWPHWKHVLDAGAIEHLGVAFRRAGANMLAAPQKPEVFDAINAYGDLTRYHDADVRAPRQGRIQNTMPEVQIDHVRSNVKRINAFVARCRERDVSVCMTWAPVPRNQFQRRQAESRLFHTIVRRNLEAPLLHAPAEVVYDQADFIGASYHLHGESVRQRTESIIAAVGALEAAESAPDTAAPR